MNPTRFRKDTLQSRWRRASRNGRRSRLHLDAFGQPIDPQADELLARRTARLRGRVLLMLAAAATLITLALAL